MPNQPISLTVLHPCTRTWNSLEKVPGDRTRRYCDECDLHVRNVSELSDAQAHQLIITPGRVCISGIAKSDGILLTKARLREEARIQLRRRPLLRIAAALGLVSLPAALIACNRTTPTPDSSTNSATQQQPTPPCNISAGELIGSAPPQVQTTPPDYNWQAGGKGRIPPAPSPALQPAPNYTSPTGSRRPDNPAPMPSASPSP